MTKKSKPSGFLHKITPDIQNVLKTNSEIAAIWETLTPLSRNEWICWITFVKKADTRTEHLKRLATDLRRGKRRPCCWPGCPHRRPQTLKYFSKKE